MWKGPREGPFRFHPASTYEKMSGATIVASDSMMYFGPFASSLPHVIFSLGTAPEYEPYDVVESLIWQKYCHFFTSRSRSCTSIGTTQMGKSPAMPPPIWKKPMSAVFCASVYQSASTCMYSRPPRSDV